MALPGHGAISFEMINAELGRPAKSKISFNDPEVRALAKKPTGPISLRDFYAAESITQHVIQGVKVNATSLVQNSPTRIVELIVNPNTVCRSDDPNIPALDIGAVSNKEVILTVKGAGLIYGAGGRAGKPNGGTAFRTRTPTRIRLESGGTIGGGGGMGGQGGTGGQGKTVTNSVTGGVTSVGVVYNPRYDTVESGWRDDTITLNGSTVTNNAFESPHWNSSRMQVFTKTSKGEEDRNGRPIYNFNYQTYRIVTNYYNGGVGGQGGLGRDYTTNNRNGGAGQNGGTNAGRGGQGGNGGDFGQPGQRGHSGVSGNHAAGTAGANGGQGGKAVDGAGLVTFETNDGYVHGAVS